MTEDQKKQIVQRINRNFPDIMILRLLQIEPMWGYKIIKESQRLFGLKIRHGALYPLLKMLQANGYARSAQITKEGRIRKVYDITLKGAKLVDAYYASIKDQLEKMDIEEC